MKLQYFENLEKFNREKKSHREELLTSLQMMVGLPDLYVPQRFRGNDPRSKHFKALKSLYQKARAERQAAIQGFGKPGDFPASVLPVIEKFHAVPDYDNGYEAIFDIRDYSGSKRNGFEVGLVTSGLAFEQAYMNVPIQVYQMSGTKATCNFDLYGGALSWSRLLFDDEDWWTIEDNAKAFTAAAYSQRAGIFYALIEIVAAAKGCCDWVAAPSGCSDCDVNAYRDAASMNLAAQTILLAVRNKGYSVNAQNARFIVLNPLELRGRIRQALNVTLQRFAGSAGMVDHAFTQITSMMLTNRNRFFVILPKIRLKGGYRMDLTFFNDFDILTYADTQAGWLRYGGCVGDTDQIECIDVTMESGSCP